MELTIVCPKWLASWLSYYVHFFSCKQFDGQKEVEQCFQKLDECIPYKKKVFRTWQNLIVNKELLSMTFCARKINIQEDLYIFLDKRSKVQT